MNGSMNNVGQGEAMTDAARLYLELELRLEAGRQIARNLLAGREWNDGGGK